MVLPDVLTLRVLKLFSMDKTNIDFNIFSEFQNQT